MAPEVNADDALQIQIETFEQCRDPVACPRVLVEGSLRFDVDEVRMALPQALGQEGRVPAPRAVESLPHLRNPATAELRVRLGHDEGVAERRLRRSPLPWHYATLASEHERVIPEHLGERVHEDRVDVGVDTAALEQALEADEVGVMGVSIPCDFRVVVVERFDERLERHVHGCEEALRQLPVSTPGLVMVVEVHPFRASDGAARGQAQVEHQMERLSLLAKPENEVEQARNTRHGYRVNWGMTSPSGC